jgi:hypothetical protein
MELDTLVARWGLGDPIVDIALGLGKTTKACYAKLRRASKSGVWTAVELELLAEGRAPLAALKYALPGKTQRQIVGKLELLRRPVKGVKVKFSEEEKAAARVHDAKGCFELFPGRSLASWRSYCNRSNVKT